MDVVVSGTAGNTTTLETQIDELTLKLDDADLIRITNEFKQLSNDTKRTLDDLYDSNKKYYLGKQLGTDDVVTDNRIFISVETIVPIATSEVPKPNVLPGQNTEESIVAARDWEKILMALYKEQEVQRKAREAYVIFAWRSIVFLNIIIMRRLKR